MIVVALVMAGVTYGGHLLAGKAKTARAFFTADGGLPWWAVSASLYATVLSAVSFISIPAGVFREGGNLTFLQLVAGLALGKVVIAYVFVGPYYHSRSCATVYDYLTARIGPVVAKSTMVLQISLLLLQNSIVIVSAALLLNVLTDLSISLSCLIIVGFAILWSWMGGLRTVVWTDAMLFGVFVVGAVLSAWFTVFAAETTLGEAYRLLDDQAKFKLVELSTDPQKALTIWTGLITGTLIGMIPITSQSGMQRVRACSSEADARKAFWFSVVLYAVPVLLVIVGLGLSLYYTVTGMPDDLALRLQSQPDQVFPYFIVNEIPDGVSGIFIAAIFAAAITTLDSRLTELSDVTVANIYRPYIRRDASEAHYLIASRLFLIFWGVVFSIAAFLLSLFDGQSMIDLTFLAANMLGGPILGIFLLARYGLGTTAPILIGTAISVAMSSYLFSIGVTHYWWFPISLIIMLALGWLAAPRKQLDPSGIVEPDHRPVSGGLAAAAGLDGQTAENR